MTTTAAGVTEWEFALAVQIARYVQEHGCSIKEAWDALTDSAGS